MINLSKTKHIMPTVDPATRICDFMEVNLGYTEEQAISEAKRCLDCKHQPCVSGCPVSIDIPGFILEITQGHFETAYQIIRQSSLLPSVCGRVCPQETQCEAVCVRGIKGEPVGIGNLERFVSDVHFHQFPDDLITEVPKLDIKVAVIGSGPAGLSCANDLSKYGYQVDIYEALHTPGGVLTYGIPAFRLPKSIVLREIDSLKKQGVNIITNAIIGKTLTIDDLFDRGYRAIFLGTGAGLPKFMGVPGEMYNGVYSANEYLTRINLMKAYETHSKTPIHHGKKVAVIGGGNVALDAARCAKRLGASEVYIIYRRSMQEIPARSEEIHHAIEEGINFQVLTNLKQIIGDEQGHVKRIVCANMILGEPDHSGRPRPIEKPDQLHTIEVDTVIMAIGTTPNPLLTQSSTDIKQDNYGCMLTHDAYGLTSRAFVYAGGDAVTGSATVILAMGAGRKAAEGIHHSLSQKIKQGV
jgi:glutamate synthase (NADPH/NADH) small chain